MAKKDKRLKILDIRYISIIIGLIVFVIVAFLSVGSQFQLLSNMEGGLLDQYFRLKVENQTQAIREGVTRQELGSKVSPQIVIIGIDPKSLGQLGRWPWPRSVQARVLQSMSRLSNQNNREQALLLDIFYIEKSDPAEDRVLLDSMKENSRVFLENIFNWEMENDEATRRRMYAYQDVFFRRFGTITKVSGEWEAANPELGDEPPLPQFASVIKGFGHANYLGDPDNVYRNALLVARFSRLLREEKNIPIDSVAESIKNLKVENNKFEWLAWLDKKGVLHQIKTTDEAYLKQAAEEMSLTALREMKDGKETYTLRHFKDFFVPSMVLTLACEYYHKKPADVEVKYGEYIRIPDPEVFVIDKDAPEGQWRKLSRNNEVVNEIRIPIDDQGLMLINFMGSSTSERKVFSYMPFINFADPARIPDPAAPPEKWPFSRGLQNKIAIVCMYAEGMDDKTTPFGIMFGGEVHANALNTIIMDNFLVRPPLWLTLCIILAAVLLSVFIGSRLPPLLSLFISLWLIAVYAFAVIQVFDSNNLILNFSAPAIGMFFTFLAVVAYRVIFEEQDKRRLKSMFTKYVSAQVVELLLINPPELGGVDKEITVLFSDIRGFTTLSETMTPQALVNHLNIYLTEMTDLIFAYYGTLDKYVGDEIMCFWGAPLPQKNHAILACKCALKQIEMLNKLNETWPPDKRINIGIGINSGIMTVGNMGSPGRMNYTLMGDNCNLGARLEGTNKEYGTTIIISEYTYGLVRDQVVVRELDNIRVKGKNKPVIIYELIDVIDGLDPPKGSEV
jgi:adenylate cyclase